MLRSEGASPGSEASLALPERQLEFPEPAQHPQGKPDSEWQPKNSCPGHTHSPERRGSEKGDGLQLSKEQPPAQPWPRSASCKGTAALSLHSLGTMPRSPLATAKSLAAVSPRVTLSTAGWPVLGPFHSTTAAAQPCWAPLLQPRVILAQVKTVHPVCETLCASAILAAHPGDVVPRGPNLPMELPSLC